MVGSQRGTEESHDGVTRRTALRGLASVGLAGIALTGTAGAEGYRTITFRAASGGTLTFQLVVSGRVETDGGGVPGVVSDGEVQVAGSVVQGSLSDGRSRSFEFTGDVSILQVGGLGKVLLNGTVIRDLTNGDDGSQKEPSKDDGDRERLPKVVVVSSTIDDQRDYVFEVTGDLEKLEPNEDSGNARDEVIRTGDRVRVEGTVGTGDDQFAFSGEFIPIEKPDVVRFDVRER